LRQRLGCHAVKAGKHPIQEAAQRACRVSELTGEAHARKLLAGCDSRLGSLPVPKVHDESEEADGLAHLGHSQAYASG